MHIWVGSNANLKVKNIKIRVVVVVYCVYTASLAIY